MTELLWRIVARILCIPRVAARLEQRARRTPYFDIVDGGDVYMERWWLFNPYDAETHAARWPWIPFSIRLHHIVRPDRAEHLHDHPWNFRTIVIQGSYTERRADGSFVDRWAGCTARLAHGEYHHIAYVRDAWTVFITGRYRGSWGFMVDGRKVPWREYTGRSAA